VRTAGNTDLHALVYARARRSAGLGALAAIAILLAGLPSPAAADPASEPARARTLDINEFRVEGGSQLSAVEVGQAVYPFLGPMRALEDVERARQALEQAYSDKGFQAVAVSIPQQTVRDGVVRLVVQEGTVGRLRVRGARWFSPRDVKKQAPSVAEGAVPNFNAIVRDIVTLNQIPDRRVTPAIRAGAVPGTVDVDLDVEDKLPLHGSLEVNDRHSANTVDHRLSGSLRYDNLWQLGHSIGLSFQLAPERLDDSKVFSASYLARFPAVSWLSLSLTGVLQQSDVSTVGGIGVQGRGRIVGARSNFTLPSVGSLFHTLSLGIDYKHFDEGLSLGENALDTPITYWPMTAQYGATWAGVFGIRGLGSDMQEFDAKHFGASASFIYYRAELSRTDELLGMQLFEKALGQHSADALTRSFLPVEAPPRAGEAQAAGSAAAPTRVNARFGDALLGSEQLSAGGADSVRGYLESHVSGDLGAIGTFELRSPSLSRWFMRRVLEDWRFLAFVDGGWLRVHRALPEQKKQFELLSVGGGTRMAVRRVMHAALDVGVPLIRQGTTTEYEPRIHFRVWTEF
jgi:hemolysin activation/secretion protein